MILKEIIELLDTSIHPIARVLHKGEQFKVLAIGFKKGMILKEHVAHLPTKLFILKGKIIYRESKKEITLNSFDEIEIPINIMHAVEAIEDSLCLLTQG